MRTPLVLALAPLTALPLLAAPALAQSPSPSTSPTAAPTQTPHRDFACPVVDLDVRSSGVIGSETTITATRRGGDPDRPATVMLERVSPAPPAVVRTASVDRSATWTVRLGESHRFVARAASNTDQCFPVGEPGRDTAEVEIAPELSIGATRLGVRDYLFRGRVLPGRGQAVSLYRFDYETGRRVLTARGVVGSDGTYRIARRFTGSGRFGFLVAVPTSSTNAAGESRVRPTVVH